MIRISLKDCELKYDYRSGYDVIYKDFYLPCLKESIQYDRAAGYFTSHSLILLSEGLEIFLHNAGKIRIIANPHLSEGDIKAMQLGYELRENIITEALLRELEKIDNEENLKALAHLIYNDQLDIKIAYTEGIGIYHEKFGIFTDSEGNSVSFSGSANETSGGLENNFEHVNVFFEDYEQRRINTMKNNFNNLWKNNTEGLVIVDIPHEIKERFYEIARNTSINNAKNSNEITLREYQLEAMDAIINNNWHGILEMATGTGKTFTSLAIAQEYYKLHKNIFLVIIVPFTHLIEQWKDNLNSFNFENIVICGGENRKWRDELHMAVRDFNGGFSRKQVVITTYDTAASYDFNRYMNIMNKNSFLIADECHYFGISSMRENKLAGFHAKVGLSATPARWFDVDGSTYIKEFFKGTVYRYDLQDAIDNNFLVKYSYHPIITDLTKTEVEEYENFSMQIVKLMSIDNRNKSQEKQLSKLLILRSRIIKSASQKLNTLFRIMANEDRKSVSHTLIYCAEGQIDTITRKLSKLGYRCNRIDHKVSYKDRQKILEAFSDGKIQVIVAIKCLDEGVDVPATKTAYFLSSTSNPRQFIQRRGRILRKHPGKSEAIIYDFITIPSDANDNTFSSVVKREIPRLSEFSESAINKYASRQKMETYLKQGEIDLNYLVGKTNADDYDDSVLVDN